MSKSIRKKLKCRQYEEDRHMWRNDDSDILDVLKSLGADYSIFKNIPLKSDKDYVVVSTHGVFIINEKSNVGVGLHDAKWRSRFGGGIYENDGSHGCINLPAAFAEQLFNKVRRGTPVIIY